MRWTVTIDPDAEQLANIWFTALDRQAVTAASNQIDHLLRTDPQNAGESREENTRLITIEPLSVHFEVRDQDRIVNILTVRFFE
jgi:hypothetical protein